MLCARERGSDDLSERGASAIPVAPLAVCFFLRVEEGGALSPSCSPGKNLQLSADARTSTAARPTCAPLSFRLRYRRSAARLAAFGQAPPLFRLMTRSKQVEEDQDFKPELPEPARKKRKGGRGSVACLLCRASKTSCDLKAPVTRAPPQQAAERAS